MSILKPSAEQLSWQQDQLGVFFHFGINTFNDKEWSDGTLPAASFDPARLDARQWVRTAKEAGAKYVILTAKHHDGFCLWPTATTDYSVASSPFKGGNGDVVAEVREAADFHGLKLGLYLSPWDRNAACYSDPEAYDDFYLEQLRELCTRYGDLYELWFDGAGSEGRAYDWDRISALIAELQPHAMVFNMGRPTIRWVGNEDGLADDPVNYVVNETDFSNYTVVSSQLEQSLYLPPECDVSIRRGWFWHEQEQPKTLDHLLAIYYRSIGLGANLLLNLPVNTAGLVPESDVARVRELAAAVGSRFAEPHAADAVPNGDGSWRIDFGSEVSLDHLELRESLEDGQRVTAHEVCDASGERIAGGHTIGSQRIHVFPRTASRYLTVHLDGPGAVLLSARGFLTGVETAPSIEYLAPTEYPEGYIDQPA